MSSVYVRTEVKLHLATTFPGVIFIDLSGEIDNFTELLKDNGVTPLGVTQWVGLTFVGADETPTSVQASCYRELGTVTLHVVDKIAAGKIDDILIRCETLRDGLRSQRIADLIAIESVSPPNTEKGTVIDFDNGYQSANFFMDYYYDKKA